MATDATFVGAASNGKAFSIANFKKLFNGCTSRQYMSDMDVQQISTAIEEKDVGLLETLYEILLREKASDEQMIRDFVMTKNKLMDDFMIRATEVKKKFIENPRKEAAAKVEKTEQNNAEEILKNL